MGLAAFVFVALPGACSSYTCFSPWAFAVALRLPVC